MEKEILIEELTNLDYPRIQELKENLEQVMEGSGLRLKLIEWLLIKYDAEMYQSLSNKYSGGEINRTLKLCSMCNYLGLLKSNDIKQLEGRGDVDGLFILIRLIDMIKLSELDPFQFDKSSQLIKIVSENQKSIFSPSIELFSKDILINSNNPNKEERFLFLFYFFYFYLFYLILFNLISNLFLFNLI